MKHMLATLIALILVAAALGFGWELGVRLAGLL